MNSKLKLKDFMSKNAVTSHFFLVYNSKSFKKNYRLTDRTPNGK